MGVSLCAPSGNVLATHEEGFRAVTDIDWQDKDIVLSELLTPEQHCKYKYLGHVEGESTLSLPDRV